jgi:hypothetical protein
LQRQSRKNIENAKENAKEADQKLINAQDQEEKDWQQFKNEAELKIATNEKSDELKAEIKTAFVKFRTNYEKEVVVLEQKYIELKKKIREYKYEGKDKWEEFKMGSIGMWISLERHSRISSHKKID